MSELNYYLTISHCQDYAFIVMLDMVSTPHGLDSYARKIIFSSFDEVKSVRRTRCQRLQASTTVVK